MRSHRGYDDIFKAFVEAAQPNHPVLALQRRHRLTILRKSNLRRHSHFFVCGPCGQNVPSRFSEVFRTRVPKKGRGARGGVEKGYLQGQQCRFGVRRIGPKRDLGSLLQAAESKKKRRPLTQSQEEHFNEEAIKEEPYLKVQTVREHLIGQEMAWDP